MVDILQGALADYRSDLKPTDGAPAYTELEFKYGKPKPKPKKWPHPDDDKPRGGGC